MIEWDFGFPREILNEHNNVNETAYEVAKMLAYAFDWSKTYEGFEFWSDVHRWIMRIAAEGR